MLTLVPHRRFRVKDFAPPNVRILTHFTTEFDPLPDEMVVPCFTPRSNETLSMRQKTYVRIRSFDETLRPGRHAWHGRGCGQGSLRRVQADTHLILPVRFSLVVPLGSPRADRLLERRRSPEIGMCLVGAMVPAVVRAVELIIAVHPTNDFQQLGLRQQLVVCVVDVRGAQRRYKNTRV